MLGSIQLSLSQAKADTSIALARFSLISFVDLVLSLIHDGGEIGQKTIICKGHDHPPSKVGVERTLIEMLLCHLWETIYPMLNQTSET